ncbi:MAG: hypothetical protein M0Q90_15685 [Bacteroidales bacterium]|nr:hypothetical protein [Bacteroidales bacterium]
MKASKLFIIFFVAFSIVQGVFFATANGQESELEMLEKIRSASPDTLSVMLESANKQLVSEPVIANKKLKVLYRRFEELDDKIGMLKTLGFLSTTYYYLARTDSSLLMLRVAKSMLPAVDKAEISPEFDTYPHQKPL